MIKLFKNNKSIILYFITIISSTSFILSIYNYRITRNKGKIDPGFMQASTFDNDESLCKAGSEDISCIKKIFNDFKLSKRNILFFGNSQTGAVNDFNESSKSFVSLLQKDFFELNKQINIKGIWFPNANIVEFEKINFLLDKCNINLEILIIPVFLDDTRNERVRSEINKYDKSQCFLLNQNKEIENSKYSNLEITNKKIKSNLLIFSLLSNMNKNFRLDIYRLRNFIFNIKPESVRNIREVSYKTNINAMRNILNLRKENKTKTIIYIPPLLHFESKKRIPYDLKEYTKFKSDFKDLCNKNHCSFFNLETLVPDQLWGKKSSTSFLKGKKELDFMHFKPEGHIIMSKKFLDILAKFNTY